MNRIEHQVFGTFLFLSLYFGIGNYYPFVKDVVFFVPSLIACLYGSILPDVDLVFGIQYHRSLITHSPILPSIVGLYYLILPYPATIRAIIACFLIGYASHLLLDNIPRKYAPIEQLIVLFDFRSTPGNLRGISSSKEGLFLIASSALVSFNAFLLMR